MMNMHHHPDVREPPWPDSSGHLLRAVGRMGLALFAGGLFGVLAWPPRSPPSTSDPGGEGEIADAALSASAEQEGSPSVLFDRSQAPAVRSFSAEMPAIGAGKKYDSTREFVISAESTAGLPPRFTAAAESLEKSTPIENSRGPP
ncbi:MAG: hypothetical protein MI923_26345 [Phycisphaerales bacterium]|nr:hypothetical protein [Phycisphaerales bacterium]